MAICFMYPLAWSVSVSTTASFREEDRVGPVGPHHGARVGSTDAAIS